MNCSRSLLLAAALLLAFAPGTLHAQRNNASRVDFDDQLVQGQVNRGAVHLIERKDSDLGSLVKVRKNYRKEILAGTAVEDAAAPVKADISAPKGLPVVKPAETVEAAPKAEAKVETKTEPAKAAVGKIAPKSSKKPAAKKTSSKSKPTTAKSNGGNRVVSRR